MKTDMRLTAVFSQEDDGGFISYIEEMPGVNSQGDTIEEAKSNLLEALTLVMEVRRDLMKDELLSHAIALPEPKIFKEEISLGV